MNNLLTADDICRILKVCAKTGVRVFSFGEIRAEFGETPAPAPKALPMIPNRESAQIAVEEDYVSGQEVQHREDELDMMILSDPVTYEKMMLNGDLESTMEGVTDEEDRRSE